MDKIVPNWAFIHITEQIFGYLDISCLSKCLLVSKEWNIRLKKIFFVKCLKKALNVQFRVRDFDDEDRGEKISLIEMCPDWNETFTYLSHNENVGLYELQEVVRVLNIYISDEYNPRNSRGARQTPLHLAVEKGYIYFLRILSETSLDFNTRDIFGSNPFLAACRRGNLSLIEFFFNLKEKQIEKDLHDDMGQTPLHLICNGSYEVVKYFCDLPAEDSSLNFDVRDKCGQTPFHDACRRGKVQVVKLLLENAKKLKIDVNAPDRKGCTALHLTCQDGNTEVVRLMLEGANSYGINVLALDNRGNTILQSACFQSTIFGSKQNPETVQLILQQAEELGLDVHHENNQGKSAFGCAQRMGFQLACDILKKFSLKSEDQDEYLYRFKKFYLEDE